MARNLKANAALLNQLLDSGLQTTFDSGFLNILTTPQATDASQAESGTLLATIDVPADSMAAASGGILAKTGTWEEVAAIASGTAFWFRLKNAGDTIRLDGTVGADTTVNTSGTATAGSTTTLTNTNATLVANTYVGNDIVITSGTGSGQRREVKFNTATVFTVVRPWTTPPDATSVYEVREAYDLRIGNVEIEITTDNIVVSSFNLDLSRLI